MLDREKEVRERYATMSPRLKSKEDILLQQKQMQLVEVDLNLLHEQQEFQEQQLL